MSEPRQAVANQLDNPDQYTTVYTIYPDKVYDDPETCLKVYGLETEPKEDITPILAEYVAANPYSSLIDTEPCDGEDISSKNAEKPREIITFYYNMAQFQICQFFQMDDRVFSIYMQMMESRIVNRTEKGTFEYF